MRQHHRFRRVRRSPLLVRKPRTNGFEVILTRRLYSSTRFSMVSLASPEEPSMRVFSAESDRIRSSLAARAVSSSFTFALKAAFCVRSVPFGSVPFHR